MIKFKYYMCAVCISIFFTACGENTEKMKAGAKLYSDCAGCHGSDGKTKALGKAPILSGQSDKEILGKLQAYKAGTLDVTGMGKWKTGLLSPLSDDDIDALAVYISTLK